MRRNRIRWLCLWVLSLVGISLRGGAVSAQHDHRIAMAAAVAACACTETVTVEGWECTNTSYPRFREDFNALKREETP